MKTAEEILKETLPSFGAEWIKDMKPELYDGIIEAMEEYRSQLTESKELPGDEQCDEIAFRRLLLTNRDSESELQDRMLVVDGLQMMRSIASPLLASRDARIRELEEELEREKNSVRIITKDVVDQILNPSLEIGKTYKTKGGSKGTVIAWIAQIKMYQVKYWNDEIHEVNSKGEAVLLDNINATPYDLILTPPKN